MKNYIGATSVVKIVGITNAFTIQVDNLEKETLPQVYSLIKVGSSSNPDEYTISIVNCNTNINLVEFLRLSQVSVNGTVYNTYDELSAVATPILFKKGGGAGVGGETYTTAEKQKVANAVVTADLPTANVGSATKLQTARTINGTAFDGTANVTTAQWGTPRVITIGNWGKSINGTANITWTLAEIGAVAVTDMIPVLKTIPYNVLNSRKYNGIPNKWINILLNSQGVDKTFLPFIEVSDDGITWTNLNVTDIYKYFTSHEINLNITNPFFRFTFKTIESLYQYFYIGMRHRTSGLTLSGKYEFSANGADNWVENTEGGNSEQVASAWGPLLFYIRNSASTRFHRLTIQKHAGVSVGFVQLMMYSNVSEHVDSYTVAKTDLETIQLKPTSNLTLSATHVRATIIATANRTITVPTTLPDNFECTFIADGGDIQFATSGTTFKLNGGKTLLKNGGTAVLIKEIGTANFYLKGDLT